MKKMENSNTIQRSNATADTYSTVEVCDAREAAQSVSAGYQKIF